MLGLISMRLDGKKDIQSVKSAQSILHAELETHVLPPCLPHFSVNNKGHKTNINQVILIVFYQFCYHV